MWSTSPPLLLDHQGSRHTHLVWLHLSGTWCHQPIHAFIGWWLHIYPHVHKQDIKGKQLLCKNNITHHPKNQPTNDRQLLRSCVLDKIAAKKMIHSSLVGWPIKHGFFWTTNPDIRYIDHQTMYNQLATLSPGGPWPRAYQSSTSFFE